MKISTIKNLALSAFVATAIVFSFGTYAYGAEVCSHTACEDTVLIDAFWGDRIILK